MSVKGFDTSTMGVDFVVTRVLAQGHLVEGRIGGIVSLHTNCVLQSALNIPGPTILVWLGISRGRL